MKKLILCSSFLITFSCTFCQKKVIDHSDYGAWPGSSTLSFTKTLISFNGDHVVYFVGAKNTGLTMTIQETNGTWRKEVPGAKLANMSSEGKFLLYMKSRDTLVVLDLQSKSEKTIPGVQSYKLSDESTWFGYLTKGNELTIQDLSTNKVIQYPNVGSFYIDPTGTYFVMETVRKEEPARITLSKINLKNFSVDLIYQGKDRVENIGFDRAGEQMAFYVKSGTDMSTYEVFYYKSGMDSAIAPVRGKAKELGSDFIVSSWKAPKFSSDGNRLFFNLEKVATPKVKDGSAPTAKLEIWHYLDQRMPQLQLKENRIGSFRNVQVNIKENKIYPVSQVDDYQESIKLGNQGNGEYALVFSNVYDNEKFWNNANKPNIYLVSLKDGSRRILHKATTSIEIQDINFSPDGNYVIWYDRANKSCSTLNLRSGETKVITKNIAVPLYVKNSFPAHDLPFGIAGWVEGGTSVLIYDQYDIWKVDAAGLAAPVNITNGYGRKHEVRLRVAASGLTWREIPIIRQRDKLLLSATSLENSNNGFYQINFDGKATMPTKLVMAPYNFLFAGKAKGAENYFFVRSNIMEAPNLFMTQTFNEFRELSTVHPENKYNWMTGEMIKWKMFDGKENEGILYKPENFDPNKKYPIIFNYYQYTGALHRFQYPESSDGEINIPYFVSNGYVVLRPGIQFIPEKPGYSAYNSIVSAIKYLSRYSWFDSSKIGLSGISYGGYETNYLVTHTNKFAAAATAAGPTNLISDYNSLWSSMPKEWMYESSQGRIGYSLWERPDLYMQNSPILKANKVETPLLILHNRDDEAVSWMQGVELFTALRRLGKRAWLLAYDGEQHGLFEKENRVDFSKRLVQFFDHYLKEKPVPLWMSKGIPAISKGIESGFESDMTGVCGSQCTICNKDKKGPAIAKDGRK